MTTPNSSDHVSGYFTTTTPSSFSKITRDMSQTLGRLIWIFVYVLDAQTSAGQVGPRFKRVCQRVWKINSSDFKEIWLL